MAAPFSARQKQEVVHALRFHHLNTLTDLCRVERAFAALGTYDVTEPMTSAWTYYVDSQGLLLELRSLTRSYPFSNECIDEAKRRVYSDPESNRSWNLAWLILNKAQSDNLIEHFARCHGSDSIMWGGRSPSDEEAARLSGAMASEWAWAVDRMLRHWEQPPRR